MLRLTVLLLVLANGVYFAWSQDLLTAWGWGPARQSETQRLGQQIHPETLRIIDAAEAERLEPGPAPARTPECLLAGPFDEAAARTLRQALAAWPPTAWTLEPVAQERPEVRGRFLLRLPLVDDVLRARLQDLEPVLGEQPLRPCR